MQLVYLATTPGKGEMLGLGDALIKAVLGYGVVFIGLLLLMIVISIVGKIMVASTKNKAAVTEKAAPAASVPEKAAEVPKEKAPGSAGDLKLYDTDPKVAAMIMAIVADKTGKPLNELRFKSIKEVK